MMKSEILLKLAILSLFQQVFAFVEFTNVKCESTDPTFHRFEYCYIKAINRTYKYMSVHSVFHTDRPLDVVKFGLQIYKRSNGYKPFLNNITLDMCKYLKNRNHMVFKYFHEFFEQYSDMNHTCPYRYGVRVEKLPVAHIDNLITKVLPIPAGDYMAHTAWFSDNILRANVRVYVNIRE